MIKYPYTDFHEMNLDWLLEQMKSLNERMDSFVDEITADIIPIVQQAIEQGLIDVTYDSTNETVVLVPGAGVTSQNLAKFFQISGNRYPVADATAREDIRKLSVFVTPEMYGAVGDGVTDDTVAIQSAIDSGYRVKFPNDYLITDTIHINNAVSANDDKISVDFENCKINYTGVDFAIVIGDNVPGDNNNREEQIISNLTLIARIGSGIKVANYASYVRINNCLVMANKVGIMLGDENSNVSLNTIINNCIVENVPRMTANSKGIQVNTLDNSIVKTNVFFFKHQIEATGTGAGLYMNMVHSLGNSPFDSVFFYDDSNGDNHLISCYADTDKTIVGGTSVNGTNIVEDIYYYSYSSALVGQILFDTVKRHVINGGMIASGHITTLTGVTRNIYNSVNRLYGWDIQNVKFGGSYTLLHDGFDVLFTEENPSYFWTNAFQPDRVLRVGYISGFTRATYVKLKVAHSSSGSNPANSFELCLILREDGCTYKVLSGTVPTGTNIFIKRVVSTTNSSCWEICIQFAYYVHAPSIQLDPMGTNIFPCAINNPSMISDYPYITDTTGYTQATAI